MCTCVCVCDLMRPDRLSDEEVRGLDHGDLPGSCAARGLGGLSLALLEARVKELALGRWGLPSGLCLHCLPGAPSPKVQEGVPGRFRSYSERSQLTRR